MVSDLHVHTLFSCDSETPMENYCEQAIKQDIGCVCFTDHVDYNKNDSGYGFYKPQEFFEEFKRMSDKYSDRIELLCGIEFSEPHLYKKELEELSRLPYDFILGSIHFWMNDLFASEVAAKGIPLEEAFERYWSEVFRAVSVGGFDSLAHMDFPKRYYKHSLWNEKVIYDIFKVMVNNNISLEINTSSLRKGLSETMPGKDLLAVYEKAGGRNVTVGSDTHFVEDLAKGYDEAVGMLTPTMVNGFYKKRRFFAFSEV